MTVGRPCGQVWGSKVRSSWRVRSRISSSESVCPAVERAGTAITASRSGLPARIGAVSAKIRASIRAFGLDVVTALCDRLLRNGAPGLHFYTLNQAGPTTTDRKSVV